MASKHLRIIGGLDGQRLRTIPVAEDTKIHDILVRMHKKGKGLATLFRGVQRLQPETTVGEAGLEDGEELSLLWSKKYYETAWLREGHWQSAGMDQYKDLVGGIYVQIPEMVNHIEPKAFFNCGKLTEVVIPDSVTNIGEHAFDGCSGLTEVAISKSLISIGKFVFDDCSSLTKVVIPNSVTSIGSAAFRDCSSLTQVVIPDSVTSIGNYTSLQQLEVVISDSTSIGGHAFHGCSLTEVVMPKSLISVGGDIFHGCSSLAGVTTNGADAFHGEGGLL